MRPDLGSGSFEVSRQNSYTSIHEGIPVSKSGLTHVVKLENESQHSSSFDGLERLGGVIQESLVREQQGVRRRMHSPIVWRLVLMIGDGVLLIALLTLLLVWAPLPHLGLQMARGRLGRWDAKLLWGCLALVSWGIAVSITQAQEVVCASSRFKSPLRVLFALVLTLIFWMGLTYSFDADRLTSHTLISLLFLVVAAPAFSIWRVTLAELMSLSRFRRQAVIVGINTAGETIAKELQSAKHSNATVLGYISESIDERSQKDGLPMLGGRSALRNLAQGGIIDMIIMATDYKASPALFQEAIEATQLGISMVPMTMVYEQTSGKIPVEHVGDQWYLALPLERTTFLPYLCWRKVMDVIFGLIGSALLLLVLPILALLIYLDSPGPIFYSQERVGYQGRKFRILKFRSMCTEAERPGSAIWAAEGDKRVTRIGRLMRATHLDELPQVLNILRGDMSLIGPRPERQEFVSQLEKTIPFYRCRLSVKPGLTGWAQVKYPYASTSDDALIKSQYDLYYIKHQSFTLDIFIILKTVVEVLLCHGR